MVTELVKVRGTSDTNVSVRTDTLATIVNIVVMVNATMVAFIHIDAHGKI